MITKKGTTLVELIVSMAIFMIVVTLCVGAFISVSNIKNLSTTELSSQQKIRVALNMSEKLSRQAQKLAVKSSGKRLELYYGEYQPNGTFRYQQGIMFEVKANGNSEAGNPLATFNYAECSQIDNVNEECRTGYWSNSIDLLSGSVVLLLNTSHFFFMAESPSPALDITLNGFNYSGSNNSYFKDNKFEYETTVPLENVR